MPPTTEEEGLFEEEGNGQSQDQKDKKKEEDSKNLGTDSKEEDEDFNHPMLKGKSKKEIEEYFNVLELANKEQGQRLNRQHEESTNRRIAPREEEEPKKKRTSADFFEDPMGMIEEVVNKQMSQIVAPFAADMARGKVAQAWSELHEEYPDSVAYKPLIKELLGRFKIAEPNLESLKAMYVMAIGEATLKGNVPSKENGNREEERVARRDPPPQHRASGQPLKQSNDKKKLRDLTENEKTIARMNKMSDEEYLKYLEEDTNIFAQEAKK